MTDEQRPYTASPFDRRPTNEEIVERALAGLRRDLKRISKPANPRPDGEGKSHD